MLALASTSCLLIIRVKLALRVSTSLVHGLLTLVRSYDVLDTAVCAGKGARHMAERDLSRPRSLEAVCIPTILSIREGVPRCYLARPRLDQAPPQSLAFALLPFKSVVGSQSKHALRL